MENSIKLNLNPDGHEIESAGQRSSYFLKSHGMKDEAVQLQINILKELIKIGIKYGKLMPKKNELSISLQVADNAITLEVSNPVDITCHNRLKELDKTIQFIRGYQDPFEAYIIMKEKASGQSSKYDAQNLDLIKYACEGNVILDFFVNENNVLSQSAVRSLNDT